MKNKNKHESHITMPSYVLQFLRLKT